MTSNVCVFGLDVVKANKKGSSLSGVLSSIKNLSFGSPPFEKGKIYAK